MAEEDKSPFTQKTKGAPVGRPKNIKTPAEFDRLVDEHARWCQEQGYPMTWTGLALALGLPSRRALTDYATKYGDQFAHSAKRAKMLVEASYERRLHSQSPTGAIFGLKNLGWSDSSEVNHRSSDGSMSPAPPVVDKETVDKLVDKLIG